MRYEPANPVDCNGRYAGRSMTKVREYSFNLDFGLMPPKSNFSFKK